MIKNIAKYLAVANLVAQHGGLLIVVAPPGTGVLHAVREVHPDVIDIDYAGDLNSDVFTQCEPGKFYFARVSSVSDIHLTTAARPGTVIFFVDFETIPLTDGEMEGIRIAYRDYLDGV